jgi:hypothetical protein
MLVDVDPTALETRLVWMMDQFREMKDKLIEVSHTASVVFESPASYAMRRL